MKLYDSPLSGNAYKVRLFLSLLDTEYEEIPVDLRVGENRRAKFLARNSRAQIPALEAHLDHRHWLVETAPAIADVACYPYVALAPEGHVSLDDWSNVLGWIRRVQSLPRYVGMEGISGHG